jgi:hypothetical protein
MRLLFAAALLLTGLALSPSHGHAQQADARDFELGYFAPHQSIAINVYGRHEGAEKPRNYTATSGFFRATHLLKTGNWVFVPFDFLLPVTNLTVYTPISPGSPLNAAIHTTGIGDLIWIPTIGTGITQNAEVHTHTWFALTPYVVMPTGNYATSRLANTGSNRWQFRPQIIVGQRFGKAFTLEAFANVAIYGKNDEYRVNPLVIQGAASQAGPAGATVAQLLSGNKELEQKPSIGAALLAAMDLSKTFILSASYYYAKNGRQSIDLSLPQPLQATALANLENVQGRQTIHTLRVGMGIRVEKQTQLLFQLNQDLAAENAPISRGFFVRVTHLFFPPPKASTSRPDFGNPGAPPPQAAAEPPPDYATEPAPVQGPSPR